MSSPESALQTEARHSLVLIAGTGATAVLSLVYTIYAGRLLGPGGYSTFVVALSFVQICSVAVGPVNSTIAHFGARYRASGEYGKLRTLLQALGRRVATWGLLACLLVALVARPLAGLLNLESVGPLLIALAIVYLSLLLALARGALRGLQRFHQYNLNQVFDAAVRLACGIVLLHTFATATAGVAAYVLALLATLVLSRLQMGRLLRMHSGLAIERGPILRFTVPMLVLAFASAAFQNVDMLVVKHFLEPTLAGYYGAAATLARSVAVLFIPMLVLSLPHFTALHGEQKPLLTSVLRLCGYYAALSLLPIALFWLAPEQLIGALYGQSFHAAASLLLPLAVALTLSNMAILAAQAFAAAGRFGFLAAYLLGLAVELTALSLWHETPATVARVVLITQASMLAVLLIILTLEKRP